MSNNGSPRFTDFLSLCACSESSLTNLIGSSLNLLCFQIHSKPECRWTWPEVAILSADQKERGLWGRECFRLQMFQNGGRRILFFPIPHNALRLGGQAEGFRHVLEPLTTQ